MRTKLKKTSKVHSLIVKHFQDNLKYYFIIALILIIGIVLGVIFVQSISQEQKEQIQTYLTNFVDTLKEEETQINYGELFRKSVVNNFVLAVVMWFVGSTVIGIPIVLGLVAFRGFCLGYTISSSVAVWGVGKGIIFFITSMLLQNIIFLPCIMALAVSGIRLYKSIMKDKRKENIKFEIIRHTIFSLGILLLLLISSFIETYLSSNLLSMCAEYF